MRNVDRPSAAGAAQTAVIFAAALAAALGVLYTTWLLARPLALLFAAAVIAAAVAPIVGWIERRLPRVLAISVVYLAMLSALAGLAWIVVPPLVAQARGVWPGGDALLAQTQALLDQWDPAVGDQIISLIQGNLGRVGNVVLSLPLTIIGSATEFILVFVMSAYLLVAMPALCRFTLSLLPPERAARADAVFRELGQAVGGYLRATVIDGAIIAAIVYVGLTVIGVQFPLVLALVAFLGEFVPVAGPIIAAIPALLVALLDSLATFVVVLVFYIVVQQFESHVLLPVIMRQQTHVPPVLGVFAFFAGAAVGGILGAIIAIPFAGAVRVIVLRVVAPAIRSWSGALPQDADRDPPSVAAPIAAPALFPKSAMFGWLRSGPR